MPTESVKKICPAAASQTLGSVRPERFGFQTKLRPSSGLSTTPGSPGLEREAADDEDDAEEDQQRHADLRRELDPLREAAREDPDVQHEGEHEPEERLGREREERRLVHAEVLGEELSSVGVAERPHQRVPDVGERPRLDVAVVGRDRQVREEAEDADVLQPALFPIRSSMPGRGVVAELPAVAADRPLHPEERDAHQDERDEVRDEEGAAAVLRGLRRKAQEVPEAHGVAGHRQDEADPGTPAFFGQIRSPSVDR